MLWEYHGSTLGWRLIQLSPIAENRNVGKKGGERGYAWWVLLRSIKTTTVELEVFSSKLKPKKLP